MKNLLILISTVLCLLLQVSAQAAPAAPMVLELVQPSGYTFNSVPRGDEFASWTETEEGRSIVKVGNTWFYAETDTAGRLVSSGIEVGTLDEEMLKQIPRHISPRIDPQLRDRGPVRKLKRQESDSGLETARAQPLPYTQNVLVILVDYTDQIFTYTDNDFQALMFGATDSVKEFFLENSYDQLTIAPAAESHGTANDGIVHITRPVVHPNLGQNNWSSEASAIVTLADGFIDFTAFDTSGDNSVSPDELSIVIVLAGYEASFGGEDNALQPYVWGHASGFPEITLDGMQLRPYTMFGEAHATSMADKHISTIGVMCHELGHLMFGLPDLYDTDESSGGIGRWGLMASGSWNFTGDSDIGQKPAHLTAWSKMATGMAIPQEIDEDMAAVSFLNMDSNVSSKRIWIDKYRVDTGEFFLLENRQQTGYDAGLPGGGLLIWHIDAGKRANTDETHKRVDLEEADGLNQLDTLVSSGDDGDPYPGSTNNMTFDNLRTPDSKEYSGAATGIAVSNISASSANMTADLGIRAEGYFDHVRYDENGFEEAWDPFTVLWLGLNMLNDTAHDLLDGIDLFIVDAAGATVDVTLYSSMAGGTPTGPVYTEAGYVAQQGWNRILFATPQAFPVSAERGVVAKVATDSASSLLTFDSSGTPSGRSYIDTDGVGTFDALCTPAVPPPWCGDINMVGLFSTGVAAPEATSITPDTIGPTNVDMVDFMVGFNQAVVNFDAESDLVISHTGTAHSGVSVTGSDALYTVSVTGLSGDGSFTLAVDTGSDVQNGDGTPLANSVVSASVAIDNTPPPVMIGEPSVSSTISGPVDFLVSYTGADAVTLEAGDVVLNETGTANGTVSVSGAGLMTRTVTIESISGEGTLGISIDASTASDTAGNAAGAQGPSTTFNVSAVQEEIFSDGFE